MAAAGAAVAPQYQAQAGGPPPEGFVGEFAGHGVAGTAFAAASPAPVVWFQDSAGQDCPSGFEALADNDESEVVEPAEHHDLWHVEQSFRMSKTDLAARPIFHRTSDAIEAHLTIVLTALAIARDRQGRTGWSIRRIIQTL